MTVPTTTRRVLVTGAAGRIGRTFTAAAAPDGWRVLATDLTADGDVTALDITDRAACRRAVVGVDAVLHLAADPSPSADFATVVLPVNIAGTWNVATAAVEAGVDRVVVASSAQAVAGYPLDVQVRESDPPAPANDYGAGKAFAEALCASLAVRSTSSLLSVRIGHFGEARPGGHASLRDRMAWLSPRDAAHLLWAAVTADITGHHVLHGVSDNAAKQLAIDATRRLVGYTPVDDAFAG